MSITKGQIVSAKELAWCIGLSERRVKQLAEEGEIKPLGGNKFNLSESVQDYIVFKSKRKVSVVTDSSNGEVIDFNVERARKTKAEADRIERQNDIDRGMFVELSQVKHDISDAVGVCANILNTLKLNIGRIAPQMPNRAMDLVGKECAKALTAIIELDEDYQEREVEGEPLNVD